MILVFATVPAGSGALIATRRRVPMIVAAKEHVKETVYVLATVALLEMTVLV